MNGKSVAHLLQEKHPEASHEHLCHAMYFLPHLLMLASQDPMLRKLQEGFVAVLAQEVQQLDDSARLLKAIVL